MSRDKKETGWEAFLDIETTGLSPYCDDLTVVGIGVCRGNRLKVTQMIGEDITSDSILRAMRGASVIYTYNGQRFDLPFIRQRIGLDLVESFEHHDLMFDCWARDLYGGLKAVERALGIQRRLSNIDGWEAIRLWRRYEGFGDEEALRLLLEYNWEDIANLKILKEVLWS